MSEYLEAAIKSAPPGTTGMVIAPWEHGEVYGVASNWNEPTSPVLAYGDHGWETMDTTASDFQCDALKAMEAAIVQAMTEMPDEDKCSTEIACHATAF